jgi:glyoxylase-like metal-dependent hydrolase (beta-lactamase superfamily II)
MLDGGAMFGVVPKSIWQKTNPADNNNMVKIAARCLLVEEGDRLTLIDAGMGNKQSEKFFSYYHRWGEETLESSIRKCGFSTDDVTDVFLTHLHFDHCGGSVKWNKEKTGFEMTFKNAKYWSNQQHWQHALDSNYREKASFLKDNILPIQESGHLNFINRGEKFQSFFDVLFVDGHTEAQMIPHIKYKDKTIIFAADLLPSTGHIPLAYVMGYDVQPLKTLDEKSKFLLDAANNNHIIFLQHDNYNECCTVKIGDKGVMLDQTFKLSDIL